MGHADGMTDSIEKRDIRRSELLKEIADTQSDSQQGSNAVKKIFTSLESAVSIPFPRRDIRWEETSEGRRHRIRLLPKNPFFLEDVEMAREWLGIPGGLFDVTAEARELAESLRNIPDVNSEPVKGFMFVETDVSRESLDDSSVIEFLFIRFIRMYKVILGNKHHGPSNLRGLAGEIGDSAKQAANALEGDRVKPGWVKHAGDPVICVVEGLLYRYRLPGWLSPAVIRYLIIGNNEDLTGLSVDGAVASRVDYDYQHDGFDVVVHGVDEFMDLKTWTDMYRQTVKPIADLFLEARGNREAPRVGAPQDEYTQYLGVLKEYADGNRSLGSVITKHPELKVDQRTIERRVRELAALLKPRGSGEE